MFVRRQETVQFAVSWKQHEYAGDMVMLTGYPVIVVVVVMATGEIKATP
jgi:hypothetical protein